MLYMDVRLMHYWDGSISDGEGAETAHETDARRNIDAVVGGV